jgi:hypothetical protein
MYMISSHNSPVIYIVFKTYIFFNFRDKKMKNITLLAVLLLLGSMQIISAQNNNFFNGLLVGGLGGLLLNEAFGPRGGGGGFFRPTFPSFNRAPFVQPRGFGPFWGKLVCY